MTSLDPLPTTRLVKVIIPWQINFHERMRVIGLFSMGCGIIFQRKAA
jgi:hypothetical protein